MHEENNGKNIRLTFIRRLMRHTKLRNTLLTTNVENLTEVCKSSERYMILLMSYMGFTQFHSTMFMREIIKKQLK